MNTIHLLSLLFAVMCALRFAASLWSLRAHLALFGDSVLGLLTAPEINWVSAWASAAWAIVWYTT
jgi:hypothetical protein